MPFSHDVARVVCIEGPSAVGKTTLAAALGREAGGAVVPELAAGAAAPPGESAAWFVERHAAAWRHARMLAATAPLVVLDGDPLKGLWYNPVYAASGWPGVEVVAPLYRAHVAAGTLAFPDLYVLLGATEPQLRARRAADVPARARHNFETHLRLVAPQRRWFAALRAAGPGRVLMLDTSGRRDALVAEVLAAVAALPRDEQDALPLFDRMAAWAAARASGVEAPEADA